MRAQASSCYQCAVCGTSFDLSDQTTATCRVCLSECPSVAGIEIRVAQAAAKLRATVDAYRRHCHNLNYARDQWESLRSADQQDVPVVELGSTQSGSLSPRIPSFRISGIPTNRSPVVAFSIKAAATLPLKCASRPVSSSNVPNMAKRDGPS